MEDRDGRGAEDQRRMVGAGEAGFDKRMEAKQAGKAGW